MAIVNAKAIELIAHKIETCGKSLDRIERESAVSKSTLSRITNRHEASRRTLDTLAAYFEVGEEYAKLVDTSEHTCAFAAELVQELESLRTYYEQKGESLRHHYESQITSLREMYDRQESDRNRERDALQSLYDKTTTSQEEEVKRLRAVVASFTTKKNIVFWVLVGIIVCLMIALIFALSTDAII